MLHEELQYRIDKICVNTQSFRIIQGNGCNLTITSDADGDSQFDEKGLKQFAHNMANWLNDNG